MKGHPWSLMRNATAGKASGNPAFVCNTTGCHWHPLPHKSLCNPSQMGPVHSVKDPFYIP